MDEHTSQIVAALLQYSFEGVDWDFNGLSKTEKDIVGNQVNLDILKKFVTDQAKKANG